MNFRDAVAALDARIIERMVPDLDRMRAVSDLLNHPERSYPAIHITGTNGKTTAARVATEILRAAGLSVGTFTSPHLHSPVERIAYDGSPVSEEDFARAYAELEPYLKIVDAKGERVTWFETLTLMAESLFADWAVNAAVVEVGMGGGWDATNLISGRVALITEIALDHPELGSTPEEIAREKVQIIKPEAIAVVAHQRPGVVEIVRARCAEVGAELRLEGEAWSLEEPLLAVGGQSLRLRIGDRIYDDLFLPLHGERLAADAAAALAAVAAFLGDRDLDDGLVSEGFSGVRSPGRLEVIRRRPLVVVDGAHNPASAESLATAMRRSFKWGRLVLVVSVLADKDAAGIIGPLARIANHVVLTQNRSPRAAPAGVLARFVESQHVSFETAVSVEGAVARALEHSGEQDCVLVAGSLYTVAEARTVLLGLPT